MPKGYPSSRKRNDTLDAIVFAGIRLRHQPKAVAGATWQGGVTPNSQQYRPTLNGEPIAGAIAARITDGDGWIDYTTPGHHGSHDNDYQGTSEIHRLFGHVELVRDPY